MFGAEKRCGAIIGVSGPPIGPLSEGTAGCSRFQLHIFERYILGITFNLSPDRKWTIHLDVFIGLETAVFNGGSKGCIS